MSSSTTAPVAGSAPTSSTPTASTISGCDSNGKMYKSVKDMWDHELQKVPDRYAKNGWYGAALEYWENTPATQSGVLGGLDHVHDIDIASSRAFLEDVKPPMSRDYALDCGAGVGRVSKNLLLPMFAKVDLLEPIAKMLEVAKKDLDNTRVGNFILSSMETAKLPENTYDVVLIQWAALYLTDDDLAAFLAMAKRSLKPNGIIFFKENCTSDDSFVVDKDDSSLTRSDAHYKRIFEAAGVKCIKETIQPQWPKDLFQVRMYGLQ